MTIIEIRDDLTSALEAAERTSAENVEKYGPETKYSSYAGYLKGRVESAIMRLDAEIAFQDRKMCFDIDCPNAVDSKDLQCQLCLDEQPALCGYHLELHRENHQAERECAAEAEACSR